MQQQIEQAKKTLETTFIEVIDAIRSNSGPIAERLLNEYSLRSYIVGLMGFLVCGACTYIEIKIIKELCKQAAEHKKNDEYFDSDGYIFISVPVVILGLMALMTGISGLIDAVSPLYSIIKSLR